MTTLTLNSLGGRAGLPSLHSNLPLSNPSLISPGPCGTLFAEDYSEEYLPSDDDYYEDEWEYGSSDERYEDFSTHEEYHLDGIPKARDLPPALKKGWETAFGIKPSKFFRELFDTKKVGLESAVVVIEPGDEDKPESVEVHCRLARPGTRMLIGAMDTSFWFDDDGAPQAHLKLFELGDGATGQGIAKELMANSVELVQQMGVKEISLRAGLEMGGYVWPKLGFTPAEGHETRSRWVKRCWLVSCGLESWI